MSIHPALLSLVALGPQDRPDWQHKPDWRHNTDPGPSKPNRSERRKRKKVYQKPPSTTYYYCPLATEDDDEQTHFDETSFKTRVETQLNAHCPCHSDANNLMIALKSAKAEQWNLIATLLAPYCAQNPTQKEYKLVYEVSSVRFPSIPMRIEENAWYRIPYAVRVYDFHYNFLRQWKSLVFAKARIKHSFRTPCTIDLESAQRILAFNTHPSFLLRRDPTLQSPKVLSCS